MERFSSTFTIGIRELFRILVPGLLFVTFLRLEFPDLLAPYGYELPLGYLLTIAFFIGLIVYIIQLYRFLPPWSTVYHKQLGRLDQEVKIALGGVEPLLTNDYNAEYKYFLELRTDRSFVERVHYFTSFYYLLVQISQLLVIFTLVEIYLIFARSLLHLIAAILFLIGAFIFHKYSAFQFGTTINEQIMTVKLNQNEFKSIQRELESQDVINVLINTCDSLLKEMILDPNKRDYRIECNKQPTTDWKTGLDTIVYIIKVHTSHPISISGEPGGYKGFYKERIESILNHIVSFHQTENLQAKAIVEVISSEVHVDSLESLVPLDVAYSNNIIKDSSPVLEVINKYHLKHVLVRGRHLVGPNPGLVHLVEQICKENPPESALDLFSGTGIIPIVLNQYEVCDITCVDKGSHFDIIKTALKTKKGIKCITADAFSFPFSDSYGLIIADPYYEDALNFLNRRIHDIYQKTRIFVFVCCGTEDEHLRAQCYNIISTHFGKGTDEQLLFGQSIFLCRR